MMINKWYFSGIILNTFILGACANQFNLVPNNTQNIPAKNGDDKTIENVLPNNYAYDLFDFAEKKRLAQAPIHIQIEAYEAANKANHPFALEKIIEIYQKQLAESILSESAYRRPIKQNVNLKTERIQVANSAENTENLENKNIDLRQEIMDEGDQNNLKLQSNDLDENNTENVTHTKADMNTDTADVQNVQNVQNVQEALQNIPRQENETVNLKTLLLQKQQSDANLKTKLTLQNTSTAAHKNLKTNLKTNLKAKVLVSKLSPRELEMMNDENVKLDMKIMAEQNLMANSINIKPINLKKVKSVNAFESTFNIKPKVNVNLKEQVTLNEINNLKNQLEINRKMSLNADINTNSQQEGIVQNSPPLKPIKLETKFYSNKILETYRRVLDKNLESKYRFLNQETENLLLQSDAYNYLQMAAKTNNTYAQILLRDYYLNIQKKMAK